MKEFVEAEESKYIKALSDYADDMPERQWLTRYFKLFKSTVIWPEGLPFIPRSNLAEGTLRYKFHETYLEVLADFDYRVDNHQRKIHFF